ncbi:MAG: HlyC/CorC family transporter [Spirochaetes bacterium]|nr:HlyC/CorC family transporter [Spirochaetota bacterium]
MSTDSSESNNNTSLRERLLLKFRHLTKNSQGIKIEDFFESQLFLNLETSKQKMIKGVIQLSKKNVRDIMIPRVDVIAIPSKIAIDNLLKTIDSEGFSRIPVYQDSIDNITGILYVKDLLKFIPEKTKTIPISRIARKPLFIPETMPLDDLLVEFKKKKLHIAIAVDEYGGFAGIITLEDILEEIVGDIEDEFDEEVPDILKINKNTYEIDSRLPISDLNELLNINLPTDEFDTIGGFVYDLFGEVPKKDEKTVYDNFYFTVNDIKGTKINRITITMPPAGTK